jgi:hypothetical protein
VAGARPAIDNASDLDLRDCEICSNSETMACDSAFSYQIPESVSPRVGAVCAGCHSHTDAVPCGINIAPHVVLSAEVKEQGYAPLQCLAVTGSVCLGFHHGGAACKTHRPGGAVAENEPWKGDIRPRTASGLGKKRNSVSTNSRRRVDGGRSMWVRRVFRLVACEMVPGQESRCWMWLMKLQMAFMADPLIASSKCKTCK